MNLEDKEYSLQFYQYLCDIVGSKEVVKTRRSTILAVDSALSNKDHALINSGSKAEGLNLKGSDHDVMLVDKHIGAYESIHDMSSSSPSHELTLLMDINQTKPGYTKLKVYDISERYSSIYTECCETFQMQSYISSNLFREFHLLEGFDLIIHGPCSSSKDGTFDAVSSFQCKKWVNTAKKWIYRSRCTWPEYEMIQSVVQHGILFVPIGCKGSVTEDLEWRISFSVAEKILIHSFSHTQLLCYALLKILLKDIIKQKHEDLICSYFLKTIMFWLCEESDHQWIPEMFVRCFMSCLTRLIYCVEYEICLHYFIPDNNLFEGRFVFEQRKALLVTLVKIYNTPWYYVFHSATFENFRRARINSFYPYLTVTSLSCLNVPSMMVPMLVSSTAFEQVLIRSVNQQDKHLFIHLLSTSALTQMQDCLHFKERNKAFYRQYQIILRYFKTGVYSSSVQAWALLASLFYKCDRYSECIQILNYSLSKCTPDNILISLNNDIVEQSIFQNLKQTVGLSLTCKYFIIRDVIMIEPYHLLPTELAPLINEKIDIVKLFPPVLYLNVLYYFCLHHLGDYSGKIVALRDLESTIRERYFIHESGSHLTLANKCLSIAKSML
ncbi:uncharacterized protein LOC127729706 [Mytilus californianus]|uniref:uncharacterized protein LOC127729706 n=1 Tax=Mytilus californianus TaxID=6549 RepID=UPI002246DD26|nr:uncharacterized protein LOC127729706 [Mytilus californianus]